MTDPTTPAGRAELRALHDKATPGPWDWEESDDELRVAAGDALTQWTDHTTENGQTYRIGQPPRSWNPTNLIYEHDVDDMWDEAEADQRRNDSALIVAAVNALPALLDALDEAEAAIARVRALAYSTAVGYSEEERILDALDGDS